MFFSLINDIFYKDVANEKHVWELAIALAGKQHTLKKLPYPPRAALRGKLEVYLALFLPPKLRPVLQRCESSLDRCHDVGLCNRHTPPRRRTSVQSSDWHEVSGGTLRLENLALGVSASTLDHSCHACLFCSAQRLRPVIAWIGLRSRGPASLGN